MSSRAVQARDQLRTWTHAVQVQSLRILSGTAMGYTGPLTRETDVYLFTLAMRGVVRAAEMIRDEVDPTLKAPAQEAIDAFNGAVPRAVDVRDVLDHFDAYMRGRGKLQKSANSTAPLYVWHEATDRSHVVKLAAAPGVVLSMNVESATIAAVEMGDRLDDTVEQQLNLDSINRTIAASTAATNRD